MNIQPTLAKCTCNHCGGHLEFETAYAGEQVACPHCGNETRLYVLGRATPQGSPPSPSTPTEPAVQSAYRLADGRAAPVPASRSPVAHPGSRLARDTKSFAPRLATVSCVSAFVALGIVFLTQDLTGSAQAVLALALMLLIAAGFSLGIIALFAIRKHGTRGILIPGFFGTVVNGVLLGMFCVGIYTQFTKRLSERRGTGTSSVNRPTSRATVSPAPPRGTPGEKKLPRAGVPIVTLLQPGTEPRKVLRFQPKAGDKQLITLTMKLAMEPGPFTNLPPVVETREITIKNVSTNGDIAYESLIKEVTVLAGGGSPAQAVANIKAAFASVKGLVTSGGVSSRGSNRRTQIKNPRSDRQLPAIVRLFHGQLDAALDTIVLPEEPVGAGSQWELRKESQGAVEKTVYDMGTVENNRVNVRTTFTMCESNQNAKGPASTGGGSGEMTIDLARLMPEKGTLVYRMDGAGQDGAGGNKFTMKMRAELRIETK